jgi:hemolysin activation/secretion protein
VRLQPGLAARAVRRELREGEVVDLRALERAMRALGDLPGLQVATALSEDAALGTVLRVELDEGPRLSGQVGLGNGGSHALGHVLADARLDVTDALGRGEQFSLTLLGTGRPLRYGQLGMQWPLVPGGLVLEAGASALSYRDRTAPDADSADAGRSRSQSIGLVHTPWRSAETTLTLHAGGEQRTLRDAAGASPRDVWRAQLALQLEHNAAQRSLELRLEAQTGVAHLLAAADRAIDAGDATTPGAGVDGRFSKLVYRLGWRQYGDGAWSGVMSLRGQHALQRNLEDSEQLAAGGPGAVRAYPGGEASSDSLDLLSLEARRPLGAAGGAWQFAAFVDAAWAQRRHRPGVTLGDNPDGPVPNRYRLAGAGVGLSHARPSGFQFSLSVAHPLGDNPGRSVGGLNSDGHRDGWRGWCQMTWQL